MSLKKIFLIVIVVIVAIMIAIWFYDKGIFSKEILRLEILGPDKAKTGEEIEYTIKYKNNGNFVLEKVKLVFELPDNSLTEDSKERISQNLKDIYPGDEQFIKFKARLLGKPGDLKSAKVSVSYVPKNLTSAFESNTTFTTQIEDTPITLDFDLPTKAEKAKDLQFSINYFSNIDYPLENMSVRVDPVSGFDFVSSDPKTLDNVEWKIPTLNKAQGGRITIKGKISADAGSTLTFLAKLGMWIDGQFVVIKENTVNVEVIQPLLYISQQVNGSASYVASPGENLHYEIFFRNIGSTPFDNLFIIVKLDGQALDMSSVQVNNAQVNDNLIVWDSKQASQLRNLGVQEEGKIDFYVKLKKSWVPSGSEVNNTIVKDSVNISQITQDFTVRVNSGMTISQKALYSDSPIQNSGPVPPIVGQTTTYTISWDIQNYLNDAKNVKVKAMLPQNVSLTGKILPDDLASSFSFDSASREIVWSAGDVPAGTGVNGDPVSIYFQVSLKPSASQKGSLAQIMGSVSVTGEDQFTNAVINATSPSINADIVK